MNGFLAGTAIVDISPGKGIDLAGYPHFPRYNTGIHDPLYASCLYLKNSHTHVAIVTLDILFFSKRHVAAVRQKIQEREGIPAANIMISCSHTHSGPWASGRLDSESLLAGLRENGPYVEGLVEKIVGIVAEAKNNAFPAEIGFGKEYCGREMGIGGNRRDPNGPCDPYVYVLAVRDAAGIVKSVLVNYALHPTLIHEESTVVTADYPGYVRETLEGKYPEAVMLFAQGTSGNQSTRYFRQGQSFSEAERIGRTMGACVIKSIETFNFTADPTIGVISEEIPVRIRQLPARETLERRVREDRARYDKAIKDGAPYLDIQNANLKLLGSEDLLGYVIMRESGKKIDLLEDEQPAEIQVITIGAMKLIGIPGEVFVEFGLEIKRQVGGHVDGALVVINELANGCLPGYVCTEGAYAEGGYEADTSLLDFSYGRDIVQKAVELAKR